MIKFPNNRPDQTFGRKPITRRNKIGKQGLQKKANCQQSGNHQRPETGKCHARERGAIQSAASGAQGAKSNINTRNAH